MKPLSDFYSRVAPYAPGAPVPVMDQALVDSAISFCDKTLVVREVLDEFTTVPGQAEYLLEAPSSQEVGRVLAVAVGGTQIEVVPYERTTITDSGAGSPQTAHVKTDGADLYLVLSPVPDTALPVKVSAALRPVRAATQLHDVLHQRWASGVVAGALSRIMSIPNQPFSDPQMFAVYAGVERSEAASARVEGSYQRVRGQMQVHQRPMA